MRTSEKILTVLMGTAFVLFIVAVGFIAIWIMAALLTVATGAW